VSVMQSDILLILSRDKRARVGSRLIIHLGFLIVFTAAVELPMGTNLARRSRRLDKDIQSLLASPDSILLPDTPHLGACVFSTKLFQRMKPGKLVYSISDFHVSA